LLGLLAAAGFAACNAQAPLDRQGFWQCLEQFPAITDAISKAAGHQIDYTDVTGNRTHLQISISDPKLEAAD
jgi:hypothetical protein